MCDSRVQHTLNLQHRVAQQPKKKLGIVLWSSEVSSVGCWNLQTPVRRQGKREPCQHSGRGAGSSFVAAPFVVSISSSRQAVTLLRNTRVHVAPCMLRTRPRRLINLVCKSMATPVVQASVWFLGKSRKGLASLVSESSMRAGDCQLPLRTAHSVCSSAVQRSHTFAPSRCSMSLAWPKNGFTQLEAAASSNKSLNN